MNETPRCFALLLAERIQQHPNATWDLLNVYDFMVCEKYPAQVTLAVFFCLVDGRGELPLRLVMVDVDDLFADATEPDPIGVFDGIVSIFDPVSPIKTVVPLEVRFDRPGTYELQLWVNEVKLQSIRIAINSPEQRV